MRTTKKITLCAMIFALGTVMMLLGAIIETLDLTVCAMASLLVVFVYIEIGSYYPWLVWICTTLATALVYSGSLVWIEYFLIFGIYPLVKAYIERLPRWSWLIVKIGYINVMIWAIFCVSELLLGIPFFGEDTLALKIVLYVMINVAFIAYDFFINVMLRFYLEKIRPRIKKLLK